MAQHLGQHFLRDPKLLDRIVAALAPAADDVVLEIGAGEGTLTRRLASQVGRVVTIETDRRLATALRTGGSAALPDNVTVLEADALALDWHASLSLPAPDAAFKVIGNIPYAITSPLIDKALTPPRPTVIVFLVQKEVADRLAAAPGSKAYGALSVGVQLVAQPERLFLVKPGAFSPPPEVDSVVIRLTPRSPAALTDDEASGMRRFVTALFGQRRKQLGRSLRDVTGLDRGAVAAALTATGLAVTARVEDVGPDGLLALYRRITR